ncbi:hypothetical protein Bca52824_020652 [Brassica carinata]|uniref:Uncharacterized protein n=1 Tax=Brassica carinata TaxID=52824 RepID=A0A8X8AZS0_BRACI|nr:hypothetical protein Bca52824_020652 [Brassica carinata]
MAKPSKSSTPPTHLSQYCNNSFENMRHDYFGDLIFMEGKLQMYNKQFGLTNSFSVEIPKNTSIQAPISAVTHLTALEFGWSD